MSLLSIELELLLLAVLLALSAFFSGSEVALISIDRLALKRLSKKKANGIETLKKLKKTPHRMLTTILIGNNFVNILMSSLATVTAIDYFGSSGVGVAVGIITFFILVFGEIFPKSYSEARNEKVALLTAPIIYFLSKMFYPIIILFEIIPSLLFKYVLKVNPRKHYVSEQDILHLAELGLEQESIQEREKDTIERILKFNDVPVKNIMTPRKEIIYINTNSTAKKALEIIDKTGHSRYLVFEDRKSNITGIVHIKEILRAIAEGEPKTKIKFLSINVLHIPMDETIDKTFKKMQKTKTHMAVVVDKDYKIKGLVTLEDIMEEIFGEIEDEEDISRSFELRKP